MILFWQKRLIKKKELQSQPVNGVPASFLRKKRILGKQNGRLYFIDLRFTIFTIYA